MSTTSKKTTTVTKTSTAAKPGTATKKKNTGPTAAKKESILKGLSVQANRFLKRFAPIELKALGGQRELVTFTNFAANDSVGFDINCSDRERQNTLRYLRGYLNGMNAVKK